MSATAGQVSEAFTRHGVIPDVLAKAPEDKLKITFDNSLEVSFVIYLWI